MRYRLEVPSSDLRGLPAFAKELVREAACEGSVEAIQVRPRRREPVLSVQHWDPAGDADHGTSVQRAVTLFQYEHLTSIAAFLGRPVEFSMTRRNVCIRGFNLEVARGARLQVGEAVLEITDRCHPCSRMNETLGPGGFAAMFGQGGWTARIVRAASIHVGDTVRLHPD